MAPYVKAMESEQPLGPCMGSPVREIKFVPEEGQGEESYTCKQEVLDSHSYSPGMDHSTERYVSPTQTHSHSLSHTHTHSLTGINPTPT